MSEGRMKKMDQSRRWIRYRGEHVEVVLHPYSVANGQLSTGRFVCGDSWPFGRLLLLVSGEVSCVLTPNQTRRLIDRLERELEMLETRE